MPALRVIDPKTFPPIKSKLVTLIRVQPERTFATSTADKRELLLAGGDASDFIAVWTGNYRSDAFAVTDELLTQWIGDVL